MHQDMPTLSHVARLAKVSENTASRVIRNKGPISEETRRRVLAAIDMLGYVPNRAAGSLATSTSPIIGVVLPSLSNIVFPDVLRGIHAGLANTDYQPMIGVSDYDREQEQRIVASLLSWQPAAIITTGFDHTDRTRHMLEKSRIRVAELMEIDERPIDLAIGFSHRAAGRAIAAHLIGRGYRHFGYVGHDWDTDRRARQRYDGLLEGLGEAGLMLVAEERAAGPSSTLAGRDTLERLLSWQYGLDVVVFSNDDMAVGGFMYCLGRGIAVPERLALFGFNGLEIGEALPTPLSTIRSNRFLIGKRAVEVLLDMPGRPAEPEIIDTGFEIIAGGTA